jgi:hypothetical protein
MEPAAAQAAIERHTDGAGMAKREGGKQNKTTASANPAADSPVTTDAMEQRVIAFAEQLGRISGTVTAKAEGWMDREALNKQIASVRDGAAELLEQLSAGVTRVTRGATKTTASPASSAKRQGRSGGVVDAPGKKHRKPAPKDTRAIAADSKRANMRSANASMKTMKRRGRG